VADVAAAPCDDRDRVVETDRQAAASSVRVIAASPLAPYTREWRLLMETVRSVDFGALRAATQRHTQWLLDSATGATSCSISCIKTPPRSGSPVGLHTHQVDQIFYVLEGTMSIEVAGATREVGPGSLIVFPAGTPHRNWNDGVEPTVHLSISVPLPDPAAPFATPVRP
jgi:quercetin dioxygenase-like cupin family protein